MQPAVSPTKCAWASKEAPPAKSSWVAKEPKRDAVGKSARTQFSLRENSQRRQTTRSQQRANQKIDCYFGRFSNVNEPLPAPTARPDFSSPRFTTSHRPRSRLLHA